MIRILNIMGWGLGCGGAETRIMNYYRYIDHSKMQFDFFLLRSEHEIDHYEDEAISLGAQIFRCPIAPKLPKLRNIMQDKEITTVVRMIWIVRIIRKEVAERFMINSIRKATELSRCLKEYPDYKIIIVHHDDPTIALYTMIAKLCKVPVRIVDSCNEIPQMPFWKKMFRPLLRATATHYMGVSENAGISLLGKKASGKITQFKHARDLELYRYLPERRVAMREQLNLGDAFVLLNIGNIRKQKNQTFLLDVFACVRKELTNTILLIVGEGNTYELTEKANSLSIGDKVRFLGQRNDVSDILQAADLFVFPSIYEGLPGAVVEAQAAGLPCLLSDTISREVRVTELVEFLPINKGAELWAKKIKVYKDFDRCDTFEKVRDAGHDIHDISRWLEGFYSDALITQQS